MERETVSVSEAARILGISRISAYKACKTGELKIIRIGKRLLVLRKALDQMLSSSEESS